MKSSLRFATVATIAALTLLLMPLAARAQDPLKVAPDRFKVLFETDVHGILVELKKAGTK